MKVLLMERNCRSIVTGIETKPEDDKKPKEQKDFEARKDRSSITVLVSGSLVTVYTLVGYYSRSKPNSDTIEKNLVLQKYFD
ncbi:hypothetical protein TNCT_590801 [Trichonephila clavata]|uniref:Uncharacterized protein n=1 Tax=Trichonephila clavata TaxID=2740835 RepID=A0A8X6LF57_TRICU|nr:hypothetical protein TNCT_590801 [Trichonephila clavata]